MRKRLVASLAFVGAFFLLSGCGGGGAGGSGGPSGRSAVGSGAKGTFAYMVGGGLGSYAGPSGSQRQGQFLLRYGVLAVTGLLEGQASRSTWEWDPDFELYFRVTQVSESRWRVDFRTEGGSNAGYIDISLTDPEPFPITVELRFNLTDGWARVEGMLAMTAYDPDLLDVRLVGNYRCTRPSLAVSYDLRDTSGVVTGFFQANDGTGNVRFSNIVATSERVTANYLYNRVSGNLLLRSDGSGYVTANLPDGRYALRWDSDFYCTLVFPGGEEEELGYMWDL